MKKQVTRFSKVYLENSSIFLSTGLDERTEAANIFVWTMNDFSKLEEDVFYTKSVRSVDCKWNFRLLKRKNTLFLALHTNEIRKNVTFKIIMKDGIALASLEPGEITDGLYVTEYSLSLIEKNKDQFLENDILRVQCVYTCMPVEAVCSVIPYGSGRNKIDNRVFCDDMRQLYTKSLFSDFIIRVENVIFRTHKLILATRSRFIGESFRKNDDYCTRGYISIVTDPSIMNEVLLYVYSGELKHMNVECMILVLRVACVLEIDCLLHKCIKYFKENLTEENVVAIHGVALEHDIKDLKNAAVHFLQTVYGNVLHTPQWKEINKQYAKFKKEK